MKRTTEQWLQEAWRRLTPVVEGAIASALGEEAAEHYPAPIKVQLSVGYWPGVPVKDQPWAICHDPLCSRDGETWTVFVSPELAGDRRRTVTTLGALLHEMIHAYLTNGHSHNRRFQLVAHAAGFRRPYHAVGTAGFSEPLRAELRRIARGLGRCPWKPLKP